MTPLNKIHGATTSLSSLFLLFFSRFSDTSDTIAVKKKEKKEENHRFWLMDLPIPLILWYTLRLCLGGGNEMEWNGMKKTFLEYSSLSLV